MVTSAARVGLKATGLLLWLLPACESPEPMTRRARNEAQNLQLFQQLIEGGTMTPLSGYDEETYLAEVAELYGEGELTVNAPSEGELEGADGPLEPAPAEVGLEEVGEPYQEPPINPYLEFGSQIYVYESGFVMKPYTFPAGMGLNVLGLLRSYGDFAIHEGVEPGSMPDPSVTQPSNAVILDLREGWAVEAWSDPRGGDKGILQAPQNVALGDLLIVTAKPDVLLDVEHFLQIFVEDVKQIEIEAKIVEVTTTDSLDIGVTRIDESTPIFGLPNPGTLVNQIDFSFPNSIPTGAAGNALFGLQSVFDGVQFNALLEAVATSENVSIISHPKVAVREGARADVVNTTEIPFANISAINSNGNFTTNIAYKPVGVQMYVIPRVVGDDTVILTIDIEASQQTGTAVTLSQGTGDNTQQVSVPQISQRQARTIVRLEPGQAVILGGLITERTLERERKVPILGDIPLLGALFRSRFSEKQQSNVLFFIRPRILQGSDLNSQFDS